jgi:hemolysin activation/secretion protein
VAAARRGVAAASVSPDAELALKCVAVANPQLLEPVIPVPADLSLTRGTTFRSVCVQVKGVGVLGVFRALTFFAIVAAGFPAAAQIPSSDQPGSERQRFVQPQPPKAEPAGPPISLTTTIAPPGADKIFLRIAAIHVVGSTVYTPSDLQPLYAGLIGQRVALSRVYDLAQKITAKYGNDGYVLSRATVPPQSLDPEGAIVTLRVIEGYVDRVEWPDSLKPYRDFFDEYSARITAERPANIKTIERYLLLAGDLPGIHISSSFRESPARTGATTLVVQATIKPLDIFALADNRGTQARGPSEYEATVTLNNLFHQQEALTGTVAGAFDFKELTYLALDYRQVLDSTGLTGFADGSYSWGKPGTAPLEALDFASNSFAADFGLSYPVIRSREHNLTFAGLFFLSDDEGDLLSAPDSNDRLRGVRLKADFDSADQWNGINQGNITFSQGIDGLGSTQNGNVLASREFGRVDFTKVEGWFIRTQPLVGPLSFRGAFDWQYAFTPLLAPEECTYGGKDFGRAFDPSAITGDRCWSASGEIRYDLPRAGAPWLDTTQLYAFADYGSIYRIEPSAGTPQHDEGSSAGIGVRLGTKIASLDLSVAKPLSGDLGNDWRFFFSASARY